MPKIFSRPLQVFELGAMLALLLIFAIRAIDYLAYGGRAITFPFGLNYAEGDVWQQVLMMLCPGMYGDITHPPFIIFEYPPVYHLLVRELIVLGIDPLAAGRSISLGATMVIAVLAGGITFAATRESVPSGARAFGAVLAGLIVFAYRPIQKSAIWMRVDMLAVAFSFAGVYLVTFAAHRTYSLYLAALMFSLAIYTKQTEFSAPIAALLVAAITNLRSVLKAAGVGLIISGAALLILLFATGGGFWQHIIVYNAYNRFVFKNIEYFLLRQKHDALALLTGVLAFVFLWCTEVAILPVRGPRRWIAAIRQSEKLRALCIVSLWFVLASAQLVTIGRRGADDNYFVEWVSITAISIGMAATIVWSGVVTGGKSLTFPGLVALFLSLTLGTRAFIKAPFEFGIVDDAQATAVRGHLVDIIRESRKPVLSDDMVLILRAGQQVFIEPAMFTELAEAGNWDQGPLLKLIQNHAFALVITQTVRMEDEVAGGVFTDEVAHAIENSYPLVERFENYVVWRPTRP